jgi:hypothetical protein
VIGGNFETWTCPGDYRSMKDLMLKPRKSVTDMRCIILSLGLLILIGIGVETSALWAVGIFYVGSRRSRILQLSLPNVKS